MDHEVQNGMKSPRGTSPDLTSQHNPLKMCSAPRRCNPHEAPAGGIEPKCEVPKRADNLRTNSLKIYGQS